MVDPGLTTVMKRRIAAFAVDFGLVGLLSAFIARSQLRSFPADPAQWTNEQLDRVRDLAGPLSRQQDLGDTKYIIPGSSVVLVLAIATILSLLVFVLLPATTGWSPGKRLTGLQVVGVDGEPASIGQYITRALVGLVDLLPGFIPGLLGFGLASRSPLGQRLGDRLAQTVVVDAKAAATAPMSAEVRASMVDIDGRLASAPSPLTPLQTPDGTSAVSEPAGGNKPPPPASRAERLQQLPAPAVPNASETIDDLSFPPPESTPAPTDIHFAFNASPPLERPPRTDLFSASLAPDDTFTGSANQAFAAGLGAGLGKAKLPPAPTHRSDTDDWEEPQGLPAPVWRPESADPDVTQEPAPPSAQTPPANRPLDEGQDSATNPVWSDEWDAWLFWDPKQHRWLRHDLEQDTWVPIT